MDVVSVDIGLGAGAAGEQLFARRLLSMEKRAQARPRQENERNFEADESQRS